MKKTLILSTVALVGLGLEARFAEAQAQVNLQAPVQTSLRVNTELYNNAPAAGSLYSSQNPVQNPLLPSEARYEIMRSGLLPSEVRAGITAAGPLAPGGVTAVTHPVSALQQAVAPHELPGGPLAVPGVSGASGSVRYSQPGGIDGRVDGYRQPVMVDGRASQTLPPPLPPAPRKPRPTPPPTTQPMTQQAGQSPGQVNRR